VLLNIVYDCQHSVELNCRENEEGNFVSSLAVLHFPSQLSPVDLPNQLLQVYDLPKSFFNLRIFYFVVIIILFIFVYIISVFICHTSIRFTIVENSWCIYLLLNDNKICIYTNPMPFFDGLARLCLHGE
jgi:hypothetical protein